VSRLLAALGVAPSTPAPARPAPAPSFPTKEEIAARFSREGGGKAPVKWSADLGRILALPRRDLATAYSAAEVDALQSRLRRPRPECVCAKFTPPRPCPTHLKPIQALALLEAARVGGLLAPIGVGHGKELTCLLLPLVIPGVKTAVLMTQGNLRTQLVGAEGRPGDVDYYGGHWNLPYIVGQQFFRPGPALHIYSYDNLSRQSGTVMLERIAPDLIILNEAHNLRPGRNGKPSTRASRFARYMADHPETKLCALSGSMTARSIKDWAHFAAMAFGPERSPVPVDRWALEEWATALDPDPQGLAPPGALLKFCGPDAGGPEGEDVRSGFSRRRNDTAGVVATHESAIGTSLVIRERPLKLPAQKIRTREDDLREHPAETTLAGHISAAHAGIRPDGEEATEGLLCVAWARQLGSGFFHRWRYPRGEPLELINEWFARRQRWNRTMREKLAHPSRTSTRPGSARTQRAASTRRALSGGRRGRKSEPTWEPRLYPEAPIAGCEMRWIEKTHFHPVGSSGRRSRSRSSPCPRRSGSTTSW
jgi:hypothetical protein